MTNQRHQKILEIINTYSIETQDDLINKLNEAGFDVTQATVSRDIKKLHLIKVQNAANGKYIYTTPVIDNSKSESKFKNILKETVVSAKSAENIIVIKTYSGMANAAAAAIDNIAKDIIIGSIAGDDTIFVVVANDEQAGKFANNITFMINS